MRLRNDPESDLLVRTRRHALRIIRLYTALSKRVEAQVIGKQLLRSGTSVGAHVAEAAHAKSRADFCSKIEGALQELEESNYWMDLLIEAEIVRGVRLKPLRCESDELKAILITIANRSRKVSATPSLFS